jgi:hypothetical protein
MSRQEERGGNRSEEKINRRGRGNHLEEIVVVISLSHFGKEGTPEDDNCW